MKIAQFQGMVHEEKEKNLFALGDFLNEIRDENVDLVAVGEMFTCPYETGKFPIYAEPDGGETVRFCSALAKKYQIYLSAGSIPEVDEQGKVYNTAYMFNRSGEVIGKHRKVHLFDIDIQGGQYYRESDTLTAGDAVTVFDTEFGKIGICICFDLRFPELMRSMVDDGARIILVPGAFNRTTGPAHWELLFRCRALDNQCYMIGTSSASDPESSYVSYGHSILVSPWGNVIGQLDEKEGYQIHEIELDYVEKIREELPLLKARRRDIY